LAAETRIRSRYSQALEDERFELVQAAVYAKGFSAPSPTTSASTASPRQSSSSRSSAH
jgi:hypothetical protein